MVQGNHDVWLAREILEKYDNQKVGQFIRYNSLSLLEERLVPADLVNLAKWIKEQPYYINLNLNMHKHIRHLNACGTKVNYTWVTSTMNTSSGEWRRMKIIFRLSGILQRRIEKYGCHHRGGQYVRTVEMDTNHIIVKELWGRSG